MKNVLIVCTANKTRSVLAMEIANDIARKKNAPYHFESAGLVVIGTRIDENVEAVLDEIGIQSDWTPRYIGECDLSTFDAIHVMSQRQKVTLCSLTKSDDLNDKITVLGIENPYYDGMPGYRKCRDKISEFYEMYIK